MKKNKTSEEEEPQLEERERESERTKNMMFKGRMSVLRDDWRGVKRLTLMEMVVTALPRKQES